MVSNLQFSLPPLVFNIRTLSTITHMPKLRFKLPLHVSPSTVLNETPRRATTQQQQLLFPEEESESANQSPVEDDLLPAELSREFMPRHVAVTMDGNRRWANLRGLPVESGYEAGVKCLRTLIELCCKWRIRVLSVFAFSTALTGRKSRLSVIGDIFELPKFLQESVTNLEETTKNNTCFQLIVAVSYSGQYDMVQACRKIAMKVKIGIIEPSAVSESLIKQELETNCTEFPYPDFLIRTSGELRVSNFMLWQLGYTELFFSRSLWPDFGEAEFLDALQCFQQRRRRYGR